MSITLRFVLVSAFSCAWACSENQDAVHDASIGTTVDGGGRRDAAAPGLADAGAVCAARAADDCEKDGSCSVLRGFLLDDESCLGEEKVAGCVPYFLGCEAIAFCGQDAQGALWFFGTPCNMEFLMGFERVRCPTPSCDEDSGS